MFRIPSGKRSVKAVKSAETKEQYCSPISMMDAFLKGILVVETYSLRSAERSATFVPPPRLKKPLALAVQ